MSKDLFVRAETEEEAKKKRTAVILYILSGICACLNGLFAKLLYQSHPDMSSWHLISYIALVSCVISALMQGRRLKYVMYDSVPRSEIPALAYRTLQISLSVSVNYCAIRYFPLTYVNMFQNFSSIVVVVLSFIFLNESMTRNEVLTLICSFVAVSMMILGNNKTEK